MERSTLPRNALFAMIVALAPTAHAACFSMYDAKNALVYQSSTPPIDLSRTVSEQMAARFPTRALVISTTINCPDEIAGIGVTSRYVAAGDSGSLSGRAAGNGDSSRFVGAGDGGTLSGSAASNRTTPGNDVQVRSYNRADGTSVPGYTRSSPGSRGR